MLINRVALVSLWICFGVCIPNVICKDETTEKNSETQKTVSWTNFYDQGQEHLEAQSPDLAEQDFRKALNLVLTQSKNSYDAEKCEMKLADTLLLRNKISEAHTLYKDVLARRTRKYGNSSLKLTEPLFALGSIQEAEGNHSEASKYYEQALRINEKNYGTYSPALVDNIYKLGKLNQKMGKRPESAKHYKQALSILLKQPGLESSEKLESLLHDYSDLIRGTDNSNESLIRDFQVDIYGKYAKTDNKQDKLKEDLKESITGYVSADQKSQEQSEKKRSNSENLSAWQKESVNSVDKQINKQNNEDPEILGRSLKQPSSEKTLYPAFKILNDTISKQAHYDMGLENYERMIASDIDTLGPNHPSVANDLMGLAQLYIKQEKYIEAVQPLSRAVNIYEQAYGQNNILAINAMSLLASVQFHLGKLDKAKELYQKALGSSQLILGPNTLEMASILNNLAYINYSQGKYKEAKTLYNWALSSTEGAFGEQDPRYAACLQDYALVLKSLGETKESLEIENRAAKILKQNALN